MKNLLVGCSHCEKFGTVWLLRKLNIELPFYPVGFPGGASGKEPACQCMRHKRDRGFDPWARKIPWRRAWQPTPVFLLGEPHGQRSLAVQRVAKSQT